ncbi:MAG TPA: tripartite tricarboxylate transporter substrate binding protein [candidate division Zixibacteria bacterium]|nr:tripartite tricarboxylate transporter substrate binding protein [candidate division Zixibacteria bacterium]
MSAGTWIVALLAAALAAAAEAQTPYYQGRTIRIVVGYQAGDTHDLWARTYSRYMGKYLPGSPDFVVQNMPGAGSMVAANHIYNVAKPDGLTMGLIAPGLYLAQITGNREVKFDWGRFTWIGTPEHNGTLLFMRADAPYRSIEDIRRGKEPPKCSATGVGTSGHLIPRLLEETLGLKFQLVTGYPGGAEQDLALERGEVQCRAITVAAFFGREPFIGWHKRGFVRILIQTSRKRHPKIPDVPTLWEHMEKEKTGDGARRLATIALGAGGFGSWPVVSTPGLPPDRVKMLRDAYARTLQDRELAEEAKKRGWELRPVAGEELEELAREVSSQPADVVERMKKLMGR